MAEERVPLIELRNITKIFPGVRALSDVCFTLYPGEVHALCGENGAGKSTLIKVMTGAHQADEGEYLIDGKPVHIRSTHEGIAMGVSCVYQELSIAPQLDVAKNLFIGNLPLKRKLVDHRKLYADAEDILQQLGLNISPKTLAGDLSIGQQQMIEIGRALTRNARCIIMDEPTSSLSEEETETLFRIIGILQQRGIAIVYISHKLDEVMQLSDRITVLRDGQNIITLNTADTTQDILITNMIGRPLEKQYPDKSGRSQGDVVLDVQNLSGEKFHDISFQVRAGEVVGFFGLVGAGRSEIMRAIFGVDIYKKHKSAAYSQYKKFSPDAVKHAFQTAQVRMLRVLPSSLQSKRMREFMDSHAEEETGRNSVFVCGKPLRPGRPNAAIKAGIGFCTEDRKKEGLALPLSILLNSTVVKLPQLAKVGIVDRKAQSEDANKYVTAMRTKTPSITQLAGNLSGGNQQKVVLAKWLTLGPQVLILDEPTRGIDVGSKAEIYEIINDLAKSGMAIVVVSSEIEEILGVCDSVITIFEGKKTAHLPITPQLSTETVLACSIGKADVIEAVNKGGASA